MVDELRTYGQAPKAGAERHFGNGKQSCHLSTDSPDLEELHQFAARIGLRREWFQGTGLHAHYDLTPNKRARALRGVEINGVLIKAVFVDARTQARQRAAILLGVVPA